MSAGLTFRDMTAADVAGGLRLSRAASWNQLEQDWRALLAPPSVFRVAARDGRVVGTAGAVVYGDALAWVCMVLVDPEERGRGLGTSLVEQVLERLAPGLVVGLDATPSGQPVYARLGFSPASTLARLERAPAELRGASGDSGPRPRPLGAAALPRVLAWDREVFGADRSPILAGCIAAASDSAWLVELDDELVGYCCGRPGFRAAQIGPVVARDFRTARALVSACLAARPAQRFYLDVPAHPEWRSALQQLGFVEQRPFARMYRGGRAAPGRSENLFAIVGPEFG